MCFAITYSFISHRESLSTMSCTDTTEARKNYFLLRNLQNVSPGWSICILQGNISNHVFYILYCIFTFSNSGEFLTSWDVFGKFPGLSCSFQKSTIPFYALKSIMKAIIVQWFSRLLSVKSCQWLSSE